MTMQQSSMVHQRTEHCLDYALAPTARMTEYVDRQRRRIPRKHRRTARQAHAATDVLRSEEIGLRLLERKFACLGESPWSTPNSTLAKDCYGTERDADGDTESFQQWQPQWRPAASCPNVPSEVMRQCRAAGLHRPQQLLKLMGIRHVDNPPGS
jgi:hypothetical protein